jgi:hypothetical protein
VEHDHQRALTQAGIVDLHAIAVGIAVLDSVVDVRRNDGPREENQS